MIAPITVTIPVGPYPSNKRWLKECLESINAQSSYPAEVLIIDDGAELSDIHNVRIWKTPWRSGVAHAFNYGVALAENELVIMLGSDDRLLNPAVEQAYSTWTAIQDSLGYYAFIIEYASDGRLQGVPCNGAMTTRTLWKHTGGFPPEAAIGACDTWLLSIMYAANGRYGNIYPIGDSPLYWYRDHPDIDTNRMREMSEIMTQARNLYILRKLKELE